MRKLIDYAFGYMIAALAAGVFYREFTKFNGFDGRTTLGFMHVHLFMLGMAVFLLLALFARGSDLTSLKPFRTFMVLYNIGLPLSVIMMLVRGIAQVTQTALAPGADAALSGIAGIGHLLLGAGLVCAFMALRRSDVAGARD